MTKRPQPVQNPDSASKSTLSTATRPSPFASGPVAMVNQIRPGFAVTRQFPGQAVHAAPTQLSTPLVPQRHPSVSVVRALSDSSPSFLAEASLSLPDATYNSPGQDTSAPALDHFGRIVPSPSQEDQSRDPFDSLSDPAPLFHMQHMYNNVPRQPNRMLPVDLVGRSSAPGRLTQQDTYENLFDSREEASMSSTMLSRHSSLSSHDQTPSGSSRSQLLSGVTQQDAPYQKQQSSLRAFGEIPPPASPFLGYEDNSQLQSVRAFAPSSSTPDLLLSDARNFTSPARSTPPAATSRPPSLCQITLEAPSSDELVDDFFKIPLAERFKCTENAVPHISTFIPDTVESLEVLYAQKRWGSLMKRSLSMLQSPLNDINVTLEIKSWWLAGLIKDGQYDNAGNVLDQIGNLDELSVAGGASPFVPIRMLLLEALLSKCQGKHLNYEKQLFRLILRLQSAIQQRETMSLFGVPLKTAARWLQIAQFAVANHLVHQRKFMMALRICSQIDAQFIDGKDKVVVLSRVGRIRLQMGDLTAAEKLFEAARYHTGKVKASGDGGIAIRAEVVGELEARLLLNDGLLFFAQNKLQEALSAFDSILHLQVAQVLSSTNVDAELFLDEDVVCSAVNNYAVCALYCCEVKAAVVALEQIIKSNPQRFLNGVVVFNLSSLYDLQFDNATSKSRKEMMKKIAKLYDLEHVDPAAYRI